MRPILFVLAREAMPHHLDWQKAIISPEPSRRNDVIIIGAGGHGLAKAYYLAKNHGVSTVAVLE